ncbi:MAG: response regulator [Phycisphaerales bacterium]|nr:response regulator [Phycisphaerales bacterium]
MNEGRIGTILIVDDEEELKFVLCAHLRHAGYEVLTAGNGVECLQVARDKQPDVIVMDVNMPQMDGLTATRRLKSDSATAHIPVIMLTARSGTEDLVRGLEAGAQEYLAKPFDMCEILARVRTVHRLAMSRKQIEELNRRLESEVKEKTFRLQVLYDYMRALSEAQTRDEILDLIVHCVRDATGANRISLMLADDTGEFLVCARAMGMDRSLVKKIRVGSGDGVAGRVFQSGKTMVAQTIGADPRPAAHDRKAADGRWSVNAGDGGEAAKKARGGTHGTGNGSANSDGNGSANGNGNAAGHDSAPCRGVGGGSGRSAGDATSSGNGHEHGRGRGGRAEGGNGQPAGGYASDAFMSTPLISASLRSQDEVLGVLNVTEKAEPGPFAESEIECIRSIADAGAIALHNLQRRVRLQDSVHVLLKTVGQLSEYRDDETSLHLERVSRYARALARRLADAGAFGGAIDDEFVEMIALAAPMHDIGKIGIPDNVLTKPGALTDEEFAIMKTHTQIGQRVLSMAMKGTGHAPLLQMCVDIAYSHHERFDGRGYPRGLEGEEIPLAARIIALVDAYDAITSVRRYKPAQPHERAVEIIRKDAGKHFDPIIAQAFIEGERTFDDIRRRHTDHRPKGEYAAV